MAVSTIVPLNPEIIKAAENIQRPHNLLTGRDPNALGVHSSYPFMTPKYALHRYRQRHEYEDTMARMFIQVPPDVYQSFLDSLQDEETKKIAQVMTGDNVNKGGKGYLDFFLSRAVHDFNEKVQIVETLSDSYVAFFFGHSAPIFQYQGYLMNTFQDDWTMRMYRIFKDLARGTQLARRKFVLRLRYDSMIVNGAMLNLHWENNADIQVACPFSFGLLVKSVQIMLGGLTTPTDLIHEKYFAPDGYHLEDAGGIEAEASQTYIGGPSSSTPEGVSESEPPYNEFTDDETGTSWDIPQEPVP